MSESTKMTIYLDSQIYKDVKKLAIDLDKKISDVAEEAFLEYLKKHKVVK